MEYRENLKGTKVRIIEDSKEGSLDYYNNRYNVTSVVGWTGTIKESSTRSPWVALDQYPNENVAFSLPNLEEIIEFDIKSTIINLEKLEQRYENT